MADAGGPTFERRIVACDDARLEVFVGRSTGPLICTTHPFVPPQGNTAESLRTSGYVRALASAGQLVVVNPRGTGRSSPVTRPEEPSMGQLAADLEAVRRGLGAGRWVVAGGSSGADVALLYALAYPEALRALLLFTTGPVGAEVLGSAESLTSPRHRRYADLPVTTPLRTEPSALGRPEAEWRQLGPELWCYCEAGRPRLMLPRRVDAPPSARHRAALEEFVAFDVAAELGRIGAPTLVVCAGRDELVPERECRRLAAIPGAQIAVLEQSGHGLDEIERFGEVVRRFLAERVDDELGVRRSAHEHP